CTLGPPFPIEHRDEVDDHAREQHDHIQRKQHVQNSCDESNDSHKTSAYAKGPGEAETAHQARRAHRPQPANDASSAGAMPPSPVTAMFSGVSRKTLLVTRSMRP